MTILTYKTISVPTLSAIFEKFVGAVFFAKTQKAILPKLAIFSHVSPNLAKK